MAARNPGRKRAFADLGRGEHAVIGHAQRRFLGLLAGDGLVERGAERIEVRPRALVAAVGGVLLVRRIADLDDAGERAAHLGHRPPCGAEVEQHRRAVLADQDVVRSDVAMQQVGCVQRLQRFEQRCGNPVQLGLRRPPSERLEPGVEALPLLEVHHHVGGGVGLEHARHPHDAGMAEAGERLRLAQEAGAAPIEGRLVPLRLRPHAQVLATLPELGRVVLLERDRGLEVDVLGPIGDAEAPRADQALDAVAAIQDCVLRQAEPTVHPGPPGSSGEGGR